MVTGNIKHTSALPPSTQGRSPSIARGRDPVALVALAQGSYFVGTGIWPLVSIHSFERVTGPKTDHWLLTLRRGYSPTGSRFITPATAGTPRRRCPRH